MRPALPALAAGAALVLSGCSFSFFSGAAVPASSIEEDVIEYFLSSDREVTVTCPEDLEAEVGATLQCSLLEDERERVVEVVVDSVEEGQVSYSFRVLAAEASPDDAAQTGDTALGTAGQGSGDGQGEGTPRTAGPDDAVATSGTGDDQVFLLAADVEETIAAEVRAQTGEPATVTCPEDLIGVAGTRLVCDLSSTAGPASVEVVVDRVTETDIHYSFEVVG